MCNYLERNLAQTSQAGKPTPAPTAIASGLDVEDGLAVALLHGVAAGAADPVFVAVERRQLGLVQVQAPQLVLVVLLLGAHRVPVAQEVDVGGAAAVAEELVLDRLAIVAACVSGACTYIRDSISEIRKDLFL